LMTAVVWLNFAASTVFLVVMLLYVCHVVETFQWFPWYQFELLYGFLYLTLITGSAMAVCAGSDEVFAVLIALFQLLLDAFYSECPGAKPDPSLASLQSSCP